MFWKKEVNGNNNNKKTSFYHLCLKEKQRSQWPASCKHQWRTCSVKGVISTLRTSGTSGENHFHFSWFAQLVSWKYSHGQSIHTYIYPLQCLFYFLYFVAFKKFLLHVLWIQFSSQRLLSCFSFKQIPFTYKKICTIFKVHSQIPPAVSCLTLWIFLLHFGFLNTSGSDNEEKHNCLACKMQTF